jgi:hypothetical protein
MRRIEPEFIRRAVERLLLEIPELADDEDLRHDMIEGETEVFELLGLVLGEIREGQVLQAAIHDRIEAQRARLARFERREGFHRKLAQRIMEAAGLRKVVLAEATLSIRPGPAAVRIVEESMLPSDFWRVKREPDVAKIKVTLKAGEDVPGAALSNVSDTLAIITR